MSYINTHGEREREMQRTKEIAFIRFNGQETSLMRKRARSIWARNTFSFAVQGLPPVDKHRLLFAALQRSPLLQTRPLPFATDRDALRRASLRSRSKAKHAALVTGRGERVSLTEDWKEELALTKVSSAGSGRREISALLLNWSWSIFEFERMDGFVFVRSFFFFLFQIGRSTWPSARYR